MSDLSDLPDPGGVPTKINPDLRKWLGRMNDLVGALRTVATTTGTLDPGAPAPAPAPAPGPVGPPGPAGPPMVYVPDLTAPPTPSGVSVTAGLNTIFITTDPPVFTQGHGYARTIVYGAKYPGTGPLPTFASAVVIHEFQGSVGSFSSDLGTQWHVWLKWLTIDGVESVSPEGGTNGRQATTGVIGTTDLGPLIVEAGNLANGSVTASKIAAAALDATKFAASIEPVTIVIGSTLPTTLSTRTIYLTGTSKLYRWNGTAYVASIPTTDLTGTILDAQIAGLAAAKITGTLTDAQLAAISAAKITGTLTDAQLAAISAAKITGQITSTQITDGSISTPKLAAGAVTAATIAADTITAAQIAAGAITSTELAAGAVTAGKITAGAIVSGDIAAGTITGTNIAGGTITGAKIAAGTILASNIAADTITGNEIAANAIGTNELAANSVVAGKIAAGAITATQIAAGAVRADKLLVTGRGAALNDDPSLLDASAWTIVDAAPNTPTIVSTPDGLAGPRAFLFSGQGGINSRPISLAVGRKYRVSCYAWRTSGTGTMYLRIRNADVLGADTGYFATSILPSHTGTLEGFNPGSPWTRYAGEMTIPANTLSSVVEVYASYGVSSGNTYVQDIRIDEMTDADLIVDGAIVANKIAANAIAVGSAAIQNGAIVNAMLANATIDDAKIANLAVTKLTGGSMQVGAFIQSTNYTSGAGGAGFRINADGSAELQAAYIRGQLTSSQINGNGLTIRTAGGALLLDATAGALDFAVVSGATKPANNATVGATIGTNLGGTFTLGNIGTYMPTAVIGSAQIANLAVGSAQIADASITSAKIANLAVDTLQLAGNAVTVPGADSLASASSIGSSPATYLTLNLDPGPAAIPVWVHCDVLIACATPISGGSGAMVTVTLIADPAPGASAFARSVTTLVQTMIVNENKTVGFSYYDTRPVVGSRTYRVEASLPGGGGAFSVGSGSSLFAIGIKK